MLSLILATVLLGSAPGDVELANADWAAHNNDPDLRYLTLSAVPEKKRQPWYKMLCYSVPSASREPLLDRQLPQPVAPTSSLYRIDLHALGWNVEDWNKVVEKYPYEQIDPKYPPLVIRGDWLCYVLADTRDFDAYYRLIYGGKNIPKTDQDFLTFWNVDPKQQVGQSFGWVENRSQVAKQGTRFVEHFNAGGQSLWRTKDLIHVTLKADPLEALNGDFKHDGRELIVQIPKISVSARTRGVAQVYALANGEGKIVNEAPVRLVEDSKRTLGQTAIVNNASCVVCHTTGMNYPTINGAEQAIKDGLQLYAYSKGKAEEVELFHLTESAQRINRNNDDFASFTWAANGLHPVKNANLYWQALQDYRNDLTLQRAAGELYTTPEELTNALGYAATGSVLIGVRASGLTVGGKINRDTFEDAYLELQSVLSVWQNKQKAKK